MPSLAQAAADAKEGTGAMVGRGIKMQVAGWRSLAVMSDCSAISGLLDVQMTRVTYLVIAWPACVKRYSPTAATDSLHAPR